MFQEIAPTSAANTTRGSMISALMMPLPIVSATWRPKNRKAMKLKKAAQKTAYCGRRTRVETIVAMELAASCRPVQEVEQQRDGDQADEQRKGEGGLHRLDVLDHDAADLVGDVLETVDHLLEVGRRFRCRSGRPSASSRPHFSNSAFRPWSCRSSERPSTAMISSVSSFRRWAFALADIEQRHRLRGKMGRLDNRLCPSPACSGSKVRLFEQHDGLDRLAHRVDGVVHRLDQVLDVVSVERSDEALAQRQQHIARDCVGAILQGVDFTAVPFYLLAGKQLAPARSRRAPEFASACRTDRRTCPREAAAGDTIPSSVV